MKHKIIAKPTDRRPTIMPVHGFGVARRLHLRKKQSKHDKEQRKFATVTSTLEFKLFDPIQAKKSWALEFGAPEKVVDILVDGKSLLDIIMKYEKKHSKAEKGLSVKHNYGHLSPHNLYCELVDAECGTEKDASQQSGAALYCCAVCGKPDCGSVVTHILSNEEFVYWYEFEHNSEKWRYNLKYRFGRKQYDKAMANLRYMETIQKETLSNDA